MSTTKTILSLLRGEVARVDQGTESISMLSERQLERKAERSRLRALMDQSHPELPAAVRRRRRVM